MSTIADIYAAECKVKKALINQPVLGIFDTRQTSKKTGRTSASTLAGPDHQHPRVNEGTSMAEGQSIPIHPSVEYRDIPGFPGYRVGDDGSVWSCLQLVPLRGRRGTKSVIGTTWKRLSAAIPSGGRPRVSVCRSGVTRTRQVAHLVLEAFVGPRPQGQEACHGDGNVANNRLTNLRWDTHSGNMADKLAHGTHNRGVRHSLAKLTEEQVVLIRKRVASGDSFTSVAVAMGVSRYAVRSIIKGKSWGWLSHD